MPIIAHMRLLSYTILLGMGSLLLWGCGEEPQLSTEKPLGVEAQAPAGEKVKTDRPILIEEPPAQEDEATVLAAAEDNEPAPIPASEGAKASGAGIVGKWRGEISVDVGDPSDPAAAMAQQFAAMFSGNLRLEIDSKHQFTMSLMGVPIEGSVKTSGNKVTLDPATIAGLSKAEAQAQQPNSKIETLSGTLSADGKTLTLMGDNPAEGKMIFRRDTRPARKIGPSKVSGELEKSLVGRFAADPKSLDADGSPEQARMLRSLVGSMTLVLHPDRTFDLLSFMDIWGTWEAKGDRLYLRPVELMGMSVAEAKAKGTTASPMEATISSGGMVLSIAEGGPGGSELRFKKAKS